MRIFPFKAIHPNAHFPDDRLEREQYKSGMDSRDDERLCKGVETISSTSLFSLSKMEILVNRSFSKPNDKNVNSAKNRKNILAYWISIFCNKHWLWIQNMVYFECHRVFTFFKKRDEFICILHFPDPPDSISVKIYFYRWKLIFIFLASFIVRQNISYLNNYRLRKNKKNPINKIFGILHSKNFLAISTNLKN